MNHPTPEEWMACLYGEAEPRARASAEAHLSVCPECRARVETWRRGMSALDDDKATLVPPPRRALDWTRWVRPALAAALLLSTGLVAGRLMGPSRSEMREELAQARTQLEQDIRERYQADLREIALATVRATATENRRWLDGVTVEWAKARVEDRRMIEDALLLLDERREADAYAVRSGLLGLARYTGSGFEQAQNRFNQLTQVSVPESQSAEPSAEKKSSIP